MNEWMGTAPLCCSCYNDLDPSQGAPTCPGGYTSEIKGWPTPSVAKMSNLEVRGGERSTNERLGTAPPKLNWNFGEQEDCPRKNREAKLPFKPPTCR